jgi:hypothetical protein
MAFYALRYRESVKDPAVLAELDDMVAHFNRQLAGIMNANGELLSEAIAASNSSDTANEEHWWRKGPWTFDDPADTNNRTQAIIEQDIDAGLTLNDFAPEGIATAFGLEIGITGGSDITITGIKRPSPIRRRMLLLINQDSSRSIVLTHGSTSSADGNRFVCPNGSDLELLPMSAVLLFYTLERNAWCVVGGSGGGGAQIYTIGITVDGAGSALTTGTKGYVTIPIAGTITRWTILSTDASATIGNCKMDVYADVYANYPPTSGDSIIGSGTYPELSSARANTDATVDWTSVTLNVGDVVGFAIHSGVTPTITRVTLLLEITPS